mmetsp:Transcript_25765/g.46666  ORF Transcript_25765/g.46666 Transcript_25765/m.46666 type:complete len:164 (+) Transcript_25765:74-565(+)|eukprot:CAMPEP_0197659948 /NCGR_PEP_ID=MMETSP1338-20131121/49838_1 /TAXON_ID=43686 ORGANISM="Pelagodinium beii, Strain RCC1491" /NCGR_SAMPLE_ID=MMETSP1338 /ASSEMBLY_ACC=CAM_ASM_000754 /LENGTH=163 /DNA_ID=CAMNT_0043237153 /DNA_START=66 /DNA_END=557 /DNA_ORIENTATION=+
MAAAEDLEIDGQDLYYVPEKTLEAMKERIAAGKKEEAEMKPLLDKVVDPMKLDDEEMMLPVDMSALEQDFEGIDEMIEELGPVGTAEAFIKARNHFLANKDKVPEGERPEPMKASEWKQAIEEDMADMEDDEMEDGEEELLEDEDPEEEEEAEEPPAKKAKTA